MGIKQEKTGLKILSLDIETTGLSGKKFEKNNSDLLEIGLVFYDVKEHKGKSFKQLNKEVEKVRIIVHRPTRYLQGNFYAFNMHRDTLIPLHQKIDKAKSEGKLDILLEDMQCKLPQNESLFIIEPSDIIQTMMFVLFEHNYITEDNYRAFQEGTVKGVIDALTVAGKNVSGFDIPYLQDYVKDFARSIKMRTRVYDPTVIFADDDMDRLPSLDECLDMAREYNYDFPKGAVSHTAVEDAMDIVNLIHLQKQRGLQLKGKMKHTSVINS